MDSVSETTVPPQPDVGPLADSPRPALSISVPAAEPAWHRRIYSLLAILVLVSFTYVHRSYWAPAHGGVDQNGYLVGGKMLALHGTPRLDPKSPVAPDQLDPYVFVGRMWVGVDIGTKTERYYPKYPSGYPLLIAIALKIGGTARGVQYAYLINPIAMTLAVAATFLLLRRVAGSVAALFGMIAFAFTPLTLGYMNNPNSHATAVCFVTWGMYLLVGWWQSRRLGWAWAMGAGFLLGYAATIRYTEGLLILPLLAAAGYRAWDTWGDRFWRRLWRFWQGHWRVWQQSWRFWRLSWWRFPWRSFWRVWRETVLALAAWSLPVGLMVLCNWVWMRHVTGYDPTNESTGFRLSWFKENWDTMLRQFNQTGMYFLFPLGVAGAILLCRASWRVGVVMVLWIVPTMLIYMAYYWAPDGNNLGYLRFVLTVVPALLVGAFWLIQRVGETICRPLERSFHWIRGGLTAAAMGIAAFASVGMNVEQSMAQAESENRSGWSLAQSVELLRGAGNRQPLVPAGSVLFAPEGSLHHLQFAGDWIVYGQGSFRPQRAWRNPPGDNDTPSPFQAGRAKALAERSDSIGSAGMEADARKLVRAAAASGRRVFVLSGDNFVRGGDPRFMDILTPRRNPDAAPRLESKQLAHWIDATSPPLPQAAPDNRGGRMGRGRPGPGFGRLPSHWYLYEVTVSAPPKPPEPPVRPPPVTRPATGPTRPASAPATVPATAPATTPATTRATTRSST